MPNSATAISVFLISQDAVLPAYIESALPALAPLQTLAVEEPALSVLQTAEASVVLVDLRHNTERFLALMSRLRQTHPGAGLIGITDARRQEDKWRALRSGADHVLTEPWLADELRAMTDNLAQRRLTPPGPAAADNAGDFVLQLDTRFRVLRGSLSEQALSRSEFLLLLAFAKAPQQQLEIWEIYDVLKKDEDSLPKQALEAQIYRLRKKITSAGAGKHVLKSIRLQGYQLCNPIKIN